MKDTIFRFFFLCHWFSFLWYVCNIEIPLYCVSQSIKMTSTTDSEHGSRVLVEHLFLFLSIYIVLSNKGEDAKNKS